MLVTNLRERIKSAFNELKFEKARHIYTINGVIYPSVSSKVEGHAEKFNTDIILPKYAEKHSRDPEEVRKEWRQINEDACKLGHDTHDFLEVYNGRQRPNSPQEEAGVQFLKDYSETHEILFKELRVFSRVFRYAGTMDLPLLEKATNNIVIADYKTNADLFKCFRGKKLLPPFDFLEDCPYNKYQIQTNYYELPLREIGCKVSKRLIVHLKPNSTYRVFEACDLTKYLIDYMNPQSKKVYDNW